jgi:hypothetical protein
MMWFAHMMPDARRAWKTVCLVGMRPAQFFQNFRCGIDPFSICPDAWLWMGLTNSADKVLKALLCSDTDNSSIIKLLKIILCKEIVYPDISRPEARIGLSSL